MNGQLLIESKIQCCVRQIAVGGDDPYVRGYWVGSFGGAMAAYFMAEVIQKEEMDRAGARFEKLAKLKPVDQLKPLLLWVRDGEVIRCGDYQIVCRSHNYEDGRFELVHPVHRPMRSNEVTALMAKAEALENTLNVPVGVL